MASDIFNVQVPDWLKEISIGDVTKHERESYALGLQKRHLDIQQQHYANEEKLTGLRAQAMMLQSESRIQALASANEAAKMRLEMSQGQLEIAKSRLELAKEKATDIDGFRQRRSLLTPQERSAVDEMGNWLTPTGPSVQQWDKVDEFISSRAATPSEVTIGPTGVTQKFSAGGEKAESPLGKLYADREKAKASGNDDAVKMYDAAIAESAHNKGRSIYMGMDDNGKPIFQMTEGGAEPTVAMQSQAQEKLVQFQNTLELMNTLEHQLKPEHVGIKGKVGEVVVDKTLAQFMPGVAVGERIDARTALKVLRSTLLRQVPDASSGRMSSIAEREEVEAALPETGMFESYADASQKLKTLRGTLENRARTYSEAIGKKTPIWALSADEIKGKFQRKEITEQEALDALTRFH